MEDNPVITEYLSEEIEAILRKLPNEDASVLRDLMISIQNRYLQAEEDLVRCMTLADAYQGKYLQEKYGRFDK